MEYVLTHAPIYAELIIKSIEETNVGLLSRLTELGFISGLKIKVLNKPTKHNILVLVRNSVFALDISLCNKVVVYG